jgi:hypothetical protein
MALLAAVVVLPVVAVHGVAQMWRNKDRGGTMPSGIAGMMTELDRVVRPSVEHVVEAKECRAFHEDDIGGE